MKKIILNIFFVLYLSIPIFAFDYCTLQTPTCVNHIGCNNNGQFREKCSSDAFIVPMTNDAKQTLLNAHNTLRNKIAGGQENGFPAAYKMMKMEWDDELASLAELNVRQCDMMHDGCRNTAKYSNAGQNLFWASAEVYEELNGVLSNAVNSWYSEYKDASVTQIENCCGDPETFSKIGHFLQLVQDKASAVGCAVSRYTESKDEVNYKVTLLACNYNYGNLEGSKVYSDGFAGIECPNGVDSAYPFLCSTMSQNPETTTQKATTKDDIFVPGVINPYCDRCANHIACNNDEQFSKNCSSDASEIALADSEKEFIVKYHNEKRNIFAGNPNSGFKQAAKMMKLTWNDDLAYLADLNVKKCAFEYDKCFSTEEFPKPGQNLYLSVSEPESDIKKVFINAIGSWFDQSIKATQADIDSCCGGANAASINNFLQLIQDDAKAVGCAASKYTENNSKMILIACNYDHGNAVGESVFVSGSPTSQCPKGVDNVYSNLCGDSPRPESTTESTTQANLENAVLKQGTCLSRNDSLVSTNGCFKLTLQNDGNVVIYRVSDGVEIWSTNTVGTDAELACMQGDGNFNLYAPEGEIVWDQGIWWRISMVLYAFDRPDYAILEDDGLLALKKNDGDIKWISGVTSEC